MKIRQQIILANTLMLVIPAVIITLTAVTLLSAVIIAAPHNNILSAEDTEMLFMKAANPAVTKYFTFFILFSAVTIIITVLCTTIILSNKILAPIKELTAAAYNIKNGELDFELLGTNCREINELCYAFDDMRQQLKESKLLEEKQIMSRRLMLANISHDIKTPLTSIKGYISGIRDGVAASPEKLAKYLDTIYKQAGIIEDMVNNMSDFSMLEMSKESFNFEYGGIMPFIRSVSEEYSENEHARITTELPEKDVTVKIDYTKMRRVLCNLIDNSIKYRKGDICSILISAQENGNGVIISVSDDGIGIKNEDIGKVFESFYRADPSRTPNIKGSGLGLAIARETVERHGGKIWLKSGAEGGLTAYIYLKKENI